MLAGVEVLAHHLHRMRTVRIEQQHLERVTPVAVVQLIVADAMQVHRGRPA